MSSQPRKVRAARLVQHGSPLVVEEVALQEPGPDEVVVELAYAGVNPVDRYGVQGLVAPDVPLPRTIGVEASGTVGSRRVTVHGYGLGTTRQGLWSEAAVVPEAALVEVPDGVDLAAAAGVRVAGVTSWRLVTEFAGVVSTDRVLVLGAAGGTGSVIVSAIHGIGATVWAQTNDESKRSWVEQRGADKVVVCDADGLAAAISDLSPNVIFDPLGNGYTAAAIDAASQKGRIMLYGTSAGARGDLPLQPVYRKGLTLYGYAGLQEPEESLKAASARALQAMAEGKLELAVDSRVPLSKVNDALSRLEHRDVLGKLVLDLHA
ncbi:MAG TPA: zinc-binding alcohol dehydrogenase family protein [Acidimicrobiales bacterium]|nr:zinc-binding alcohol dehydrogenase family protein [Acidimicrobiales bacterium]